MPPVVAVQWGARALQWGARALQWGEAAVSLQDPPVPRRLTACDRSGRRWRRPNGSGDTLSRCLLTLLVAGSGHSLTKGRARETASQREEEPVGCGEGGIWVGGLPGTQQVRAHSGELPEGGRGVWAGADSRSSGSALPEPRFQNPGHSSTPLGLRGWGPWGCEPLPSLAQPPPCSTNSCPAVSCKSCFTLASPRCLFPGDLERRLGVGVGGQGGCMPSAGRPLSLGSRLVASSLLLS